MLSDVKLPETKVFISASLAVKISMLALVAVKSVILALSASSLVTSAYTAFKEPIVA